MVQDIAQALRQKCPYAYPQIGVDYRIEGSKVYARDGKVGCKILLDQQCRYVGNVGNCLL